MKTALVLINSYYKDQKRKLDEYLGKSESFGIKIVSISRTRIMESAQNFSIFPINRGIIESYRNENTALVDSISKIIREEMHFDRDFISEADFYTFGKNQLPRNLEIIEKDLAAYLLWVISETKPDVIIPGHPDNWIGCALFRIAEVLSIPAGFALETFYMSRKALIINDFSYNNKSAPIGKIISDRKYVDSKSINTDSSLLIANEKTHLKKALIEKKSPQIILRDLLKSELKFIKEWNWRRKNNLQRWMLVDQLMPGVNTIRFALTSCKRVYLSLRYPFFDVRKLSFGAKPLCVVMLHMSPEAAQLAFCRDFVDQAVFVERLNAYFGDQVEIIIKEHPMQEIGQRKLSMYRRISQLTIGFLPTNLGFAELLRLRKVVFIATLHGSVTFHCAENAVTCIIGAEHSFHKNLPFCITLNSLPPLTSFFAQLQGLEPKSKFSTAELWKSLENLGQVVDYAEDVGGQLELGGKLLGQ